jgi:PEP-CTERM motif
MHLCKSLCAIAVAASSATATQAAAPAYAGTLGSGTFMGTVAADSGPSGSPELWSFWQFSAPFMASVSITVTPDSAGFDPFIAVWYGQESNTSNYFDMTSGSMNTVFVASADGLTPFGPAGVGAPAGLGFVNDYGAGRFVLAIADYADGVGNGALGYTITASVPEPETYALMLAGLALVGAMVRRRAA